MEPDKKARFSLLFFVLWGQELEFFFIQDLSVADPDPGSGAFLTPGYGIIFSRA
jgi:hypothetical protein